MTSKRLTAGLAVAAMLLGLSTQAFADHDNRSYRAATVSSKGYARHQGPVYDYADVVSVRPIVRYVTVTTPVRECWQDTEYYTADRRPAGSAGSTLVGAIVGGVVGHQFGSGRGNDAATVAGSLIGAAIGNDVARRRANGYEAVQYSRPVTRCETHYSEQQEERIDGYEVLYRYKGQKYSTRMPHDPGRRIRVRVDIRPVA
jgi:uncharacterized protein YcfJ